MNEQHLELIELLNKNISLTGKRLSETMHVSDRQIRKYISFVNEKHPGIITSTNRGYSLNKMIYHSFLEETNRHNDSKANYSPGKRRDYLVQVILAEKTTNLFDLADECYVSFATIESDIQSIKKKLHKYDLDIRIKQNEISIVGDEINKRKMMNSIISKEGSLHFNFQQEVKTLIDFYNFETIFTDTKDIFLSNGIFANDYALNAIVLHIVIMVDRFKNNKELPPQIINKDLSKTTVYKVTKEITSLINKKFDIKISESESMQLMLVIDNNTSSIDYSIINKDNLDTYISNEIIDIATFLTNKIEKRFYISDLDDSYYVKFTIHVHNLMNRIKAGHTTKNPFKTQLKNHNPFIYDIAVYMAYMLQKKYNITINEDEISYFAIHVGGHLQIQNEKDKKFKAIFVYTDYYNLHNNIIDELNIVFGSLIDITDTVPIAKYNNSEEVDLVLMTDSFATSPKHIYIGHFLTQKVIDEIHTHINLLQAEKKKNVFLSIINNFFKEDLFYIEKEKTYSRFDVIEWITNQTQNKGYTSNEFLNDIINREKLSDTNFKTVAIPHSLSVNVEKSFIYTYISESPMQWGDSTVQLVLLIGINENDINDFSTLFDNIVEIMINPANVSLLLKNDNYTDFLSTLIELNSNS